MSNESFSRLIETVLTIPEMKDRNSRSVLLNGIPDEAACPRHDNPTTDMTYIFTHISSRCNDVSDEWVLDVAYRNVARYASMETGLGKEIFLCFALVKREHFPQRLIVDRIPRPDVEIPFVNHTDIRDSILEADSPQHHLLDGPAGYGKTELIRILMKQFHEGKNYACGYATAKGKNNLFELILELSNSLDLDLRSIFDRVSDAESLAKNFANQLLRMKFSHKIENGKQDLQSPVINCAGVVLFLDDVGPTVPAVTSDLLEIFIPIVDRVLRQNDFFNASPNRFRLIACGRYLAHFLASPMEPSKLTMHSQRLRPFDYNVVYRTAKEALLDIKPESLPQISAHILFHTGGHPGCMARVLKLYHEHTDDPDDFIKDHSSMIWNEIVHPKINEILKEVPSHLHSIIYRLSVYRLIKSKMIEELLENKELDYSKHVDSLWAELLGTFLYEKEKRRLLRDSMVRRLLVMQMRKAEPPLKFVNLCKKAYGACLSLLNDPKIKSEREFWAIEALYQALQENSSLVSDENYRNSFRASFFSEVVPTVLDSYVVDVAEQEDEIDALTVEIDNDWDFRFTLNYYLRQKAYDDGPAMQLKASLLTWKKETKDAKAEG